MKSLSPFKKQRDIKVFDPDLGKSLDLEVLIIRLGTEALAQKFEVSASTIYKWRKGLHQPSRKTLSKLTRKLF